MLCAAFKQMVNLNSVDIGFSNVVSYISDVEDNPDPTDYQEIFFTYPRLQHVTLTYAPCEMEDDDAYEPPESLYPMFGCEGSRSDMHIWMQTRLQFFITTTSKLKSLRLLHEVGLAGDKAYVGQGWPVKRRKKI